MNVTAGLEEHRFFQHFETGLSQHIQWSWSKVLYRIKRIRIQITHTHTYTHNTHTNTHTQTHPPTHTHTYVHTHTHMHKHTLFPNFLLQKHLHTPVSRQSLQYISQGLFPQGTSNGSIKCSVQDPQHVHIARQQSCSDPGEAVPT